MAMDGGEAQIDQLPMDLLAHIFVFITCFKDLAQTSSVCKKWREGVKQSLGRREKLSFAGWKMDDKSTSRLVCYAYALKELDISKSRWGCQITDNGLYQLSTAKCIINLTSISLWGMTGITDKGVVQLVSDHHFLLNHIVQLPNFQTLISIYSQISRANSLQHLNIGGTFITDESLFAISTSCPHLKSAVLWGCRHVTENGLQVLVNKCRKLESINVWGMRIALDSFIALLAIRPALQITPQTLLNIGNAPLLPVF
ncbi:hypothetical protein LXL04_006809 [Taraxacum kok-saghyz]